jgi:hypothetical protein
MTQKEIDVAVLHGLSGPATLADRFTIVASDHIVRIAFLEQGGSGREPKYRTAIAMSWADARELEGVLRQMREDREKRETAQGEATK